MINLVADGSNLTAIQQDIPPSIYLDLWAFMDIAKDAQTMAKFVAMLTQNKGTLYLSFMHLLELSKVNDAGHAKNMESLLEAINLQIFFIDLIPKNVIDRENQIMEGKGPFVAPHGDFKFLKYFIARNRQTLDPLSPKGLFSNLDDQRLQKICEEFLQKFTNDIDKLRQKRENDQKYNAHVRKIPIGPPQQRATRYIWQDLVNSLIRDEMKLENSNHYRDLSHTVVPVAYGDFCLLDKTWATKANETIPRLRKAGHKSQMAEVFSTKALNQFWAKLESTEQKTKES